MNSRGRAVVTLGLMAAIGLAGCSHTPATSSAPANNAGVAQPAPSTAPSLATDEDNDSLAMFCEMFAQPATTVGLVEAAIATQTREELKGMAQELVPPGSLDTAPSTVKEPAALVLKAFTDALVNADKSPLHTNQFTTAAAQLQQGLSATCY